MLDSLDSGNLGFKRPKNSKFMSQDSQDINLPLLALIRRLMIAMAIATVFLMALGSATRVMNAGLSCPDWPLCYGEFVPISQMNLQVFLEWFHRLVATGIGFASLVLMSLIGWYRRSLPQWLMRFGIFAVFLVMTQGALGALTVTELLRFDIVTAHLGTGLLFFATLTAGVSALAAQNLIPSLSGTSSTSKLPWLSLICAVVIYMQSILGGLVSTQWALHQCLANSNQFCQVMNNHLFGVIPVTVLVVAIAGWGWRSKSLNRSCRILSLVSVGLLMGQVAIGVGTYRLHLQVEPLTVAHQSVGALLLGVMVALTVLGFCQNFNSRTT
jgi:heme a synthase